MKVDKNKDGEGTHYTVDACMPDDKCSVPVFTIPEEHLGSTYTIQINNGPPSVIRTSGTKEEASAMVNKAIQEAVEKNRNVANKSRERAMKTDLERCMDFLDNLGLPYNKRTSLPKDNTDIWLVIPAYIYEYIVFNKDESVRGVFNRNESLRVYERKSNSTKELIQTVFKNLHYWLIESSHPHHSNKKMLVDYFKKSYVTWEKNRRESNY